MKKKIFSSLILFAFILLCGLFYGCGENKYSGVRMNAKFSYSDSEVISREIERDGLTGVRVKTSSGTVFDYFSDINLYVFYILNSSATTSANLQVSFSNTPDDFNIGASFNFDNPIGKAQTGGHYEGSTFSKNIVFFDSGSTTLTAYSNEGNKKTSISIEVVKVASSVSFVENNYAIPEVEGSSLNLTPSKVISLSPNDSSITNISYDFGYYYQNEFVSFDLRDLNERKNFDVRKLWEHGLEFNANTNILSITQDLNLPDDSNQIVVKAIYDNPLEDEDLVCYTTVKFVKLIEDFNIFYGKTYEDAFAKGPNNEITGEINEDNEVDSIQNLIVNIEDLNSLDVVLMVKTNGEQVRFNFEDSLNLPVYFVQAKQMEYREVEGTQYAFGFYKIIASKKTTENSKYGLDGVYTLNGFVDYLNYSVDNFPLSLTISLKNDALVKNYSVNGISLDNSFSTDGAYEANVYINDISNGTSLYVDVANPVSILRENSKYTLELYKTNLNVENRIENASEYFVVRRAYGNSVASINISNSELYKQATIYVQPNSFAVSSGDLNVGDVFYLVLTSCEPNEENFERITDSDLLESKRAVAIIKLTIVQGVTRLDGFDYTTSNYMVDELTGKFLAVDYTDYNKLKLNLENNRFYVLKNEENADTESNRNYVTALKFDEESNKYFKLSVNNFENSTMFYDFKNDLWYRIVVLDENEERIDYYDETENVFYSINEGERVVQSENVSVSKIFVEDYCNYKQTKTSSSYYVDEKFYYATVDGEENVNLKYDFERNAWYKEETVDNENVIKYYDPVKKQFYTVAISGETETKTYDVFESTINEQEQVVRLDLSSGFSSYISLNCFPVNASKDNIQVSLSKSNIVKIDFDLDENENFVQHKFFLTPLSIGEVEINIFVPNLNKTYVLKVSVYKPLTNFFVNLKSTNISSGVGYFEKDSLNKNVELAIVAYGKTIGLNMSTLPVSANAYSTCYNLFRAEKTYNDQTNSYDYSISILSTGANAGKKDLVCSYIKDFEGNTSQELPILQDGNLFIYNCVSNTFVFPETSSVGKIYALEITLISLDGTYLTRIVYLESYSPVETITSTLDKTQVYSPNTIGYSLKTLSMGVAELNSAYEYKNGDPTVVGIKIEVNKNSKAKATYNFDNNGTIRVTFGSNTEVYYVRNGQLTNVDNKNILLPVSINKDIDGYFWFKLNDNYNYNASNGVILIAFEIKEFNSNIFSKIVGINVLDAVTTNKIVSNSPEQLYFKLGLIGEKEYNVQTTPENVYDKTLVVKVFDEVEVTTTNLLGNETVSRYYVDSSTEELNGSINVDFSKISINSFGNYKLKISPNRAGNSVIVVMPQDKIISQAHYDSWGNKIYVSIGTLFEEDYITNFYYTLVGQDYLLSSTFEEGQTYYICATNVGEYLNIWKDYLAIYVSVADGIKIPYQISSIDELNEISSNEESVTKNYVLVSNLMWDTSKNWEPIANYYSAQVDEDNYVGGRYYYNNISGDLILDNSPSYTSGRTYFAYGFNGKFSGKFVIRNIKNGDIVNYYTINNLSYVGNKNCEISGPQGLFAILGEDAVVEDVSVFYNFYQPKISKFYVFGGVAGINYGKVENALVNYNNFTFKFEGGGLFGGVVGVNMGVVVGSNGGHFGVDGTVTINVGPKNIVDGEDFPYIVGNDVVGVGGFEIKANYVSIGGLVGVNENVISGTFKETEDIQPMFNSAGFDSSLKININRVDGLNLSNINSAVGGVAGINIGSIKNISIQGEINASSFDNVGGIAGKALYNEQFNTHIELEETITVYSVEDSFSTAVVNGKDFVGGAFGCIEGEIDKKVTLRNVSAENYAGVFKKDRIFVKGNNNVGGFAGKATNAELLYCYVVSYFNSLTIEEVSNVNNYDVYSSNNCAGFVCYCDNTLIVNNSSSFVNCYGNGNVGIFVGSSEPLLTNVFARGFINKNDIVQPTISLGYYVYWIGRETEKKFIYDAEKNSILVYDDFEGVEDWDINENINDNLPYLTIKVGSKVLPLYATNPIEVTLVAKDDDSFTSYIKYDDNSIVLFYNLDFDNLYESVKNDIEKLNTIKLSDIATLGAMPKTNKTYRFDITSSNNGVLSILNNGDLVIVGEGNAVITVSSKLNSTYRVDFYVSVKFGLNNVKLYSNVSYTTEVKNAEISTLKSRSLTMYVQKDYVRDIKVGPENNKVDMSVSLKNNDDVGFRFIFREKVFNFVEDHYENKDFQEFLEYFNCNYISDIVKINGLNWVYNAVDGDSYYYIDVPTGTSPILTPIIAIENMYLGIEYVPYIKAYLGSVSRTILLSKFKGSFKYNIRNGATKINAENNLTNVIKFNQLQTQTFTITMYTDFEDDMIISSVSEVTYDTYNDNNIFEVVENSPMMEIDSSNLLSVVQSSLVKNRNGSLLESVSITLTLNYKDKINAIEKDKIYKFSFIASSNNDVKFDLIVVLLNQDKINQVYGTVYSKLSDFPHTSSQTNTIYNGIVGTLSLEVYPYISNYSKIRVSYMSSSTHPMLLTQLSYDITGTSGDRLSTYFNSGSVSSEEDFLILEKSSGQDTYLLNNTGLYSYSKIYFISMLVSTYVPDNTVYTICVEFLSRENDLIGSYYFDIKTIAMPIIELKFDDNLLGSDGNYYLPLNTKNNLQVKLENYDGDIDWEVRCTDWLEEGTPLEDKIYESFMPYIENGEYYVNIMKYLGEDKDNAFDPRLLGHTILIKGSFIDNRIYYEASVYICVTLFTVTSINAQNVTRGYMTLPLSTTTPLLTKVQAYYDESVVNKEDNWYSCYKDSDAITNALTACGYVVEDVFINYFIQLQNAVSKVDYNFKELNSHGKKSGVWFYNDPAGDSGYLETLNNDSARDYNNSAFGFEYYNGYPAVSGYQVDVNSSLSLKVFLSYIDSKNLYNEGEKFKGIPNVLNYNISSSNSTYKYVFNFNDDFILNFTFKTDLINAIPVCTEEEFLSMEAGKDYRLVSDLVLSNYTPISTEISSFDGNNYNIYITSFSYNALTISENQSCVLGLFETLGTNSILYNVKVCYTDKIVNVNYYENSKKIVEPNLNGIMTANLVNYTSCTFGGIVGTNNGAITNCKVSGRVSIILNDDVNYGSIGEGFIGGITATNSETGFITNSSVEGFNLRCYGFVGGIANINNGKIVATCLKNSSINNLSSSTTGGFVNQNNGEIYECFVEGYRLQTDTDIRNKGEGIQSRGAIAGFVYSNSGIIADSYTNISLSSSTSISGFMFEDSQTSNISRSYTICYKSQTDNSTVAYIFAAATNYTNVVISGILNDCYYLSGTGNWLENFTWDSDESNKKATGLDFGQFTTQSFANFDLSLEYAEESYPDDNRDGVEHRYKYVDGYTWVIVEGKPVLSSSLVEATSQREYKGKSKNYSNPVDYFDLSKMFKQTASESVINNSVTPRKTYFYNNEKNKYNAYSSEFDEDDLVCVITEEGDTRRYEFNTIINDEIDVDKITIDCVKEGDLWVVVNARSGSKILDFKVALEENSFYEDKNFRANDVVLVEIDDDDETHYISKIQYCALENAEYFYDDFVLGFTDKIGSRTNPYIVYDLESFNYYLGGTTSNNFYRIIKDIDLRYTFTKTTTSNFQGYLFGNYMEINNISISYLNNSSQGGTTNSQTSKLNSFGLFAKISVNEDSSSNYAISALVNNLVLNVVDVLSNSHSCVGALAGDISSGSSRNIIISNITVQGANGNRGFIQGKNAVGGLAGFISGKVGIKDIKCSVNVNSTKEMDANAQGKDYLFEGETEGLNQSEQNNSSQQNQQIDFSKVSYAGGAVGIFYGLKITGNAENKNFNADDVLISGDISIIGGIVGSAFGYIGQNTSVNYINTVVSNGQTNFLKALAIAGGLVGENRGEIKSSSITYGDLENYTSVRIGTSELVNHNYFYNNTYNNSALTIGGLVGLNNGGVISNCISTINVRNVYVLSAGGAVGMMGSGLIENVIASGSIIAEVNIGGLIGVVLDDSSFKDTFANQNYILCSEVDGNPTKTIIRNCVADNNWLVRDYYFYKNLLAYGEILTGATGTVAGFIGLIQHSSANNNSYDNFINFEGKSFYNSTIYSSTAATKPAFHLKAAYFSYTNSIAESLEESTIYNIKNVWPYSNREINYENTAKNISYIVKTESNNYYNSNSYNDYVCEYYYTVTSTNIDDLSDIYYKIDPNKLNVYWNFDAAFEYQDQTDENLYAWFVNHFGKVYKQNNGAYIEITNASGFDINNVYIIGEIKTTTIGNEEKASGLEAPVLNKIKHEEVYDAETQCELLLINNKNKNCNSVTALSDWTSPENNLEEDQLRINSIWFNGILFNIKGEGDGDGYSFKEATNKTLVLKDYDGEGILYSYPDGVNIKNIRLQYVETYDQNNQVNGYKIKNIYVTYEYNVGSGVENNSNSNFVYYTYAYKSSRLERETTLNVASKRVVYNSFDNGKWSFGKNFYLNNDYANTDKYPECVENSVVYLWTDPNIRADRFFDITRDNNKVTIYISSPEELALLAYYVNSGLGQDGINFSSSDTTIVLTKDIDLSGKYWVPIGTGSDNSFKCTFDGKDEKGIVHSIKYATVNENSIRNNLSGTLPNYAGIFGYVDGCTVKNLVTIGGNISGKNAGGIIGYSKGSLTIENVVNKNNVSTTEYGGGIIGRVKTVSLDGETTNYGKVTNNFNAYLTNGNNLYIGGIFGSVETSSSININQNAKVENYGEISATSNKTNYYLNTPILCEVFVGGIFGYVGANSVLFNNQERIVNYAKISVSSNAHLLNIGGVFGASMDNAITIGSTNKGKLNNKGNVEVTYKNSLTMERNFEMETAYPVVNIGGIIGDAKNRIINYAGNEGSLELTITTTTVSHIGVGGIIGNLSYTNAISSNTTIQKVNECYNSGDINVLTISERTSIGVGGIVGISANDSNKKLVENCYNSATLSADGNSILLLGGIFGTCYVGYDEPLNEDEILVFGLDRINDSGLMNVKTCLNYGHIVCTNYTNRLNAVGTIVGLSKLLKNNEIYLVTQGDDESYDLRGNYYLEGCASFEGTIFTSSNIYQILSGHETSYAFEPIEDEKAHSKLTNTLKSDVSSNNAYAGWSTDIWEQKYVTWYPTLRNNEVSFSWIEKQEKTNQEKGYYSIKSAEELSYLTSQINNGLINSSEIYIQLKNTIDMSGRFWTPIGTENYPFKGTFNGGNYSIKNLTIDGNSTYGGLFGYIEDATIINVGLENPIIKNVDYAGGIVYKAKNSRIEKVYTNVEEGKVTEISANIGVGGIAYKLINCKPLDENNNLGGLYRSFNNVIVKNLNQTNYVTETGGLVAALDNSRIENCYNNSNGVTYNSQSNEDEYVNIVVVGLVNNSSTLINVFNLANDPNNDSDDSTRYKEITIVNSENGSIPSTRIEPVFENLVEIDGINLNDIWTLEYSLNDDNNYDYPYLKGLGKDWKNTESEALKSFVYGDDNSADVNTVETEILEYATTLKQSQNLENTLTMVKVLNPKLSYVNNNSHTVYTISTAEELVWLANKVNSGSLTTIGCEFILLEDIDLAGKFWTPIGSSSTYSFQGVFNFNGHIIKNLIVDTENVSYAGLFGYTSNAYIANGYIRNAFIKLKNTDDRTNIYVGTVVGKGENTTIANVSVQTRLSVFSNSVTFVGGIIGCLTGTRDYVIRNVSVSAPSNAYNRNYIELDSFINQVVEPRVQEGDSSIEITDKSISIGAFSTGGNVYCGGVVGYMSGYDIMEDPNIYLLEQSTNKANVAAVTKSETSNVYLGGIIGYGLEGVTLNVVKNSGKLKSFSVSKFNILGGIVGYLYNGNVENAYFDGYLECCQDANVISYVGGIIGNMDNYGIIKTCVNNGTIYENERYSSFAAVGGIIGKCYNHMFDMDKVCAYLASPSGIGFARAVGVVDYSDAVRMELDLLNDPDDPNKLEEYKQKTICEESLNSEDNDYAKFFGKIGSESLHEFIFAPNGNQASLFRGSWYEEADKWLIVSHIFILGCQTSFSYKGEEGNDDARLSNAGVLVDTLKVKLTYDSGVFESSDKIIVSFIKINEQNNDAYTFIGKYSIGSELFYLDDTIDEELDEDSLIVCYVKLEKQSSI